MLGHYFTVAVRNLLKYKTQNIICVLGLAVGILCFTICLYCSRYILSVDDCFPNKERIALLDLVEKGKSRRIATSVSMAEELRGMDIPHIGNIVTIAFTTEMTFNIEVSKNVLLPYSLQTIETDSEFFPVFTPQIIAGSWDNACHSPNSIVMSESAATRIFGSVEEAVGKNMILSHRLSTSPKSTQKNGGIPYVVAAVMKDIPANNSLSFMNSPDILRLNDSEGLINYVKNNPKASKNTTGSHTYALLNDGFTAKDLTKWLDDNNYIFRILEKEWTVDAKITGPDSGDWMLASITGIIGILVLLISLLNFFNFLVATFYNKTKEYSLRKVFGGEFMHLFKQLYVQASIVVLLSCLLMLSFIEITGSGFRLSADALEINFLVNKVDLMVHALQYTVLLLLVCALICLLLARRLNRISACSGMKKNIAANKVTGRNIMLWWQVFICWIFLGVVAGLYMQSRISTGIMFPELTNDMKKSIISVDFDYSFVNEDWKRVMIDKFSKHSSVEDVLVTDCSLSKSVSGNSHIYWQGNEDEYERWFDIMYLNVPDNFFSL